MKASNAERMGDISYSELLYTSRVPSHGWGLYARVNMILLITYVQTLSIYMDQPECILHTYNQVKVHNPKD